MVLLEVDYVHTQLISIKMNEIHLIRNKYLEMNRMLIDVSCMG